MPRQVADLHEEARPAPPLAHTALRPRPIGREREVKKKWVTVSLGSEDILLDTIVIGNFEYYSSTPKKLQVLGSLTYPCQQWALLGEFEADGEAAVRVIRRAPPTRLTEKSLGLFHDAAGEQAGVGHLDRFGAAEARASGGSGVWRRTRLWD